jgi:predicted RNA-binding protein with PUA-like domain
MHNILKITLEAITMAKWLLKSEPSDYSIDDLQAEGVTLWTGIRNFQARNFIRDKMQQGDEVLFYHSSCKHVAVVGTASVVSEAYADPDQFNENSKYYDPKATKIEPKWFVVDVGFKTKATKPLVLKVMKAAPELAELALFKQSRLSVIPVTDEQWSYIVAQL